MIFTLPNLICSFSQRPDNMSLHYSQTPNSLKNRKKFCQGLGIDCRDLVCAQQVHRDKVRRVREADRGKGALSYKNALPGTDALITHKRNLPLAVFTADCLSIFLYDPETKSIGLVHAGWRSTKENIAAKTIALMQKEFHTHPARLDVGFGPALRQCCYAVEEEFNNYFPDYLIKKNGRYYLDLIGINKKQLLELGVKDKAISDPGICTSCQNARFFSYRREGKNCGRIMSVIMLR